MTSRCCDPSGVPWKPQKCDPNKGLKKLHRHRPQIEKVGTDGSQRGNQRFCHDKELPVPRPWNLQFPTWEPEVTIARNCRFPEVRIYVFEAKQLSLKGTAGSQSLKLMVPSLKKHTLPVEGSVDSKKKIMVLNVVFLFTEPVTEPFVFLNGPVAECLRLAVGPAQKCFCTKKVHVKMIWKQFLYNCIVLLNGPVKNALFCLMDRYRNVCVWFMARSCRFPKVGTHCCQRGNHRLPLQGTADSRRLEVMVPNLGTRGYHCKQLPVPRGWNSCFPTWEP